MALGTRMGIGEIEKYIGASAPLFARSLNYTWIENLAQLKLYTRVYKKKRNLGISQEIDIVLKIKDKRF